MFSIRNDNPFIIFRKLQEVARKNHGNDIIDLSRGDPGYGFTPSVRGRAFAGLILQLDCILNANAQDRFLQYKQNDLTDMEERISLIIDQLYKPKTAKHYHALIQEFTEIIIRSAKEEEINWTAFDVLRELFAYCSMSGGSYLLPKGQKITRVSVAAWHRKEYNMSLTSEDIILTNGVSHGIGTVFKALGEEGCGYLKHGDSSLASSPIYAPYLSILEEREILPTSFTIDPTNGNLDLSSLEKIDSTKSQLKLLILIDPNNPTGFSLSENDLEKLAAFAKKHDLIILTDEVYSSFFPKKKTMLKLSPERTICLNARSKIERNTGLRFGEIITLPEGREFIAKKIGLKNGAKLEELLIYAKAPGRTGGQFQHTTFVPGPAQLLGTAHLILGGNEREKYKKDLQENTRVFAEELDLPHRGNLYYTLFDLNAIHGCNIRKMSTEEMLIKLAEKGVIYLPAYKFFSKKDRDESKLGFVRASVVNTTPEQLREAARRTKEVLC